MAAMNFCPKCGKTIEPGQATCPGCGADLSRYVEKEAPPQPGAAAVSSPKAKASKKGKTITFVIIGVVLLFLCIVLIVIGVLVYPKIFKDGEAAEEPTLRATATWAEDIIITNTPQPSLTPTITLTPTLGVGSTWVRPVDGMVMVYVPNSEFIMGSENGDTNEKPPHTVALDDYWIDQTEVTNAMFQEFVDETGYTTDAELFGQSLVYQPGELIPAVDKWIKEYGADWLHPHGPDTNLDGLENHPVVQISWNDASAYCEWAGARLPTEAEWELAARSTDGREFPWGNQQPSGTLANFADVNLDAIWSNKHIDDGYKFTAPVGSYPAGVSPYGALDMAGNVEEWVYDIYGYGFYSKSGRSNPIGPLTGGTHVVRGGQWRFTADGLRSAARLGEVTKYSIDYSGFRCARSP